MNRILQLIFKAYRPVLALQACMLLTTAGTQAQTVVMDSVLNNGGFEAGTSGWVIVNGTETNKWQVDTGATAGFSGTKCAFISQTTTAPFAHTYSLTNASTVQIYRDITLPAGENLATLSFKTVIQGENCCDRLRVFLAPVSVNPVAGTELAGAYQLGDDIRLKGAGWVNISLNIPRAYTGNTTAATTRRLIFQWRNDGSLGTQPPAAIDNIVFTTYCNGTGITTATNIATTTATLNWLASAAPATGYAVRYKKASDPFTVATWATPAGVAGVSATSLNVTGLTAGQTEYMYQVRDTGAGACSSWSDTSRFFTLCNPVTYAPLPYVEDFETSWINSCGTTDIPNTSWINRPFTGNPSWRREDQGASASWTSQNYLYNPVSYRGIHSARFHSGNVTPAGTYGYFDLYVNCSLPGTKELQFATINTSGSDSLIVQMSTDGGVTFTPMAGYGIVSQWTNNILPFTSASATTVIRFIGRGDNGSTDIGLDYVRVYPPCAGLPNAGTIVPVPAPCPGQNFQLAANGVSQSASLAYQWQDSTINGWQNSVGTSATQQVYTTSVTVPTLYRLVVTCVNSGQVAVSPSYLVTPASFINCFCIPTYATGATANTITSVKLNIMTNTSAGASPWYSDFTQQQPATIPIPTLAMTVADTVFVKFSTNATNYSGLWIDFNHNGLFDVNEFFTQGTNPGASGTAVIPILPPANAQYGLTRMRIRGADRAVVPDNRPCGATASAYGEAEDYYVFINYPPCNGAPNAGTAYSSATATCKGYTVDVIDTNHEYRRSDIGWRWQRSTDGGLTWNDIPNSAGKDTLNNLLISGPTGYRLKMHCNISGDSSYSVPANVRIKEPYKCYCYSQAEGDTADYSDIGAVVINSLVNSTGGPHVYNPLAVRRRSDYTDIPNIVLDANGNCHLSVYHTQRNGRHTDARVSVFIDFNNDLSYDVSAAPRSERVYTAVTTAATFYLDTVIHIPDAVIPNVPTGLRVILNEDLNPNAVANQGCGPYISGETEDYVVSFRRLPQGVQQVNGQTRLSVYPNPTNGHFTVQANSRQDMGAVSVSIMTLTGQVVRTETYDNTGSDLKRELDLGDAAKGVYFIEFRLRDGVKLTHKLVLQ